MNHINDKIDLYLNQILALLMQYAKDKDIEQLIFNCFNTVNFNIEDIGIYSVNLNNPKAFLMNILTYDLYGYKETGDAYVYKELMRKALVAHLNSIGMCYFQYHFPPILDNDKLNKNTSIRETQNPTDKINKIKCLKFFEVTDILHNIIYTYKDYHFYYTITDVYVLKILIKYDRMKFLEEAINNEILYYNIINQDRKPYINDPVTRLDILICKQIKSKNTNKYTTYNAFLGYHKTIVKALSLSPNCHWCYPNKKTANEKIKCDNCAFLLQELNELKSKVNNAALKDTDYNKFIGSIKLNQVMSIRELRVERGKLLNNFIKKNVKDRELLKSLKSMINKSFSPYVKL